MNYKEKLEEAKKLYASANADQKYVLESLFPELKKEQRIDDEILRKNLIKAFNTVGGRHWGGLEVRKILTWLEKQDDNTYSWKPTEEQYEALDYAYNSCPDTERGNYYEGVLETLIEDLHKLSEKQGEHPQGKSALEAAKEEKADNQNCMDDKVDPKFSEGDWIIRSAEGFKHNTYFIKEVKDYYVCEDLKGRRVTFTFNDVHRNFKLWDISDAKDGDVLSASNQIFIYNGNYNIYSNALGAYCSVKHNGECLFIPEEDEECRDCIIIGISDAIPATKEQRDSLLKAMADAGWEFDFEKKELKKIEQKPYGQRKECLNCQCNYTGVCNKGYCQMKRDEKKSAWSEEDEKMLVDCFNILHRSDYSTYKVRKAVDWLKSLKQRIGE